MAVGPDGLHGVTTHVHDPDEAEGIGRKRLGRVFIDVPHDVHLALAASARAMPPQCLQRDERLRPIIPFHRQFRADLLNVRWSHRASYNPERHDTIARMLGKSNFYS